MSSPPTNCRVLVALETCADPKYTKRREKARKWGARCAAPYEYKEFDGPMLGVGDSYLDLPSKTRAICSYAVTHDYDWLLILDDDVILKPEQLTVPTADYAGRINHTGSGWCSGAFYWLSRKAFTIVAEAPVGDLTAEDQWVGEVLNRHGIFPTEYPGFVIEPCSCCQLEQVGDYIALALTYGECVHKQRSPRPLKARKHNRVIAGEREAQVKRYGRVINDHFMEGQ